MVPFQILGIQILLIVVLPVTAASWVRVLRLCNANDRIFTAKGCFKAVNPVRVCAGGGLARQISSQRHPTGEGRRRSYWLRYGRISGSRRSGVRTLQAQGKHSL